VPEHVLNLVVLEDFSLLHNDLLFELGEEDVGNLIRHGVGKDAEAFEDDLEDLVQRLIGGVLVVGGEVIHVGVLFLGEADLVHHFQVVNDLVLIQELSVHNVVHLDYVHQAPEALLEDLRVLKDEGGADDGVQDLDKLALGGYHQEEGRAQGGIVLYVLVALLQDLFFLLDRLKHNVDHIKQGDGQGVRHHPSVLAGRVPA